MYQVLKTTQENPSKNDFVQTCLKYLKTLDIDLTFEQISIKDGLYHGLHTNTIPNTILDKNC